MRAALLKAGLFALASGLVGLTPCVEVYAGSAVYGDSSFVRIVNGRTIPEVLQGISGSNGSGGATGAGVLGVDALLSPLAAPVAAAPFADLRLAQLAPATVSPYHWAARKSDTGNMVFSGYVPDADVRQQLLGVAGPATLDTSELARGAPEDFDAAARQGLELLAKLLSGSLVLDGSSWSLQGRAPDAATGAAIDRQVGRLGLVDAGWRIDIEVAAAKPSALKPAANKAQPPFADPYLWKAAKADDGMIDLSGSVPTPQLQGFLHNRANNVAGDASAVASGAPTEFIANSLAALDALAHLFSGTAGYDGKNWFLTGQPRSESEAKAARAALAAGQGDAADWLVALSPPLETPAAAAQPPAAEQPEAEEPAVEKPAAEQPVAEQPVAEQPAATVPVAEKPAAEQPTAAEPAAETPAVPEPVKSAPVRDPGDPAYTFSASRKAGGAIALSGDVPTAAARRFFGSIANDAPVSDLTLNKAMPDSFINNALAGLHALDRLSDGELAYKAGGWSLVGTDMDSASRQAASGLLAGVLHPEDWTIEISAPPPIDVCRAHLAEFSGRNAILFNAGSDRITAASAAAIAELAQYLAQCPDVSIDVEGHTDADGDTQSNLILSVERAEAVIDALVAEGVRAGRLFAVGYGESLPIAPNNTRAGKARNRRIAFKVRDDD